MRRAAVLAFRWSVLTLCVLPACRAQDPPPKPAAPSRELAEVAAAYAAKVAASALFVSGRTLDSVLEQELAPTRPLEALIRPLLQFDVDEQGGTVTCRLGQATATAVRTKHLGCTLAIAPVTIEQLRAREGPAPDMAGADAPWPLGERLPEGKAEGVDHDALAKALDDAFAEHDPKHRVNTRAIVVVHDGRLVAERYAAGIHANTPLPGWSMTKTMTNALLGVQTMRGELDPSKSPAIAWYAGGAPPDVRLQHLLTMTAGLAWTEDYEDPKSDALRMLFASSDYAAVYAAQPIAAAPGEQFVYSSGETNLLCRVLRKSCESDREYWSFPRTQLFDKLGMRTAVLETDPSGTFVGSSYCFASARDWARLGMLYAQRGEFAGTRVLPQEWVDAAFTPTPASGGKFGQHLWLDGDPDGDGPRTREWPDLPADLGYMNGHEGQYCMVIPSEKLVVVRLGCTKNSGFSIGALMRGVLAALKSRAK